MEAAKFWWEAEKNHPHDHIFQYLNQLEQSSFGRSKNNLIFYRMYLNSELLGMKSADYYKNKTEDRLTINVAQSLVDTAQAQIAQHTPKVKFITEEGEWAQAQRAKGLEDFVYGVFYQNNIKTLGPDIFKDAAIFGTGCVKFISEGDKIKMERVVMNELKVDENEAMYGAPRQIHQIKFVNRKVLEQMFPKKKWEISQSSIQKSYEHYMVDQDYIEMCMVVESWHLPSGEKADDGRHCITIQGATLMDEEYKKDYFPFEFYHWNKKPLGFWGQGIIEQIAGIQMEINKLVKRAQLIMHLCSVPTFWVENGSKVNKSQINNNIGNIISFTGVKPQMDVVNAVPQEILLQIENLYNKAYELTGISRLQAQSTKPAGLNSGAALREYNDIGSERQKIKGREYEQFFINCAKKVIFLAKEMEDSGVDYTILAEKNKSMKKIKWSEVNLEEDSYIMKAWPVSLLPSSPEGKLQTTQELMSIGFIDKTQAMSLLDYPDIESIVSLEKATIDDIMATIDEIVNKGEYNPPEPFQDLTLGIKMMQASYLKYKRQGVDPINLELFTRWISDASAIIQAGQQQQMAMQMQAQMMAQQAANPVPQGIPVSQPAAPITGQIQQPV